MVVVKDMWLTGFDVPVLHTLYVDKPMRDHGLLQAIARVNRVFRDKPGGLIVDYIGIGEDLRASLRAYDEEDVDEPVIPAARAVAGLWEKYEVLSAMLHPIGFRPGELQRAPNPEKLFFDAYNLILESDEKTQEFLDTHTALDALVRAGAHAGGGDRSCATTSGSSTSSPPRCARSRSPTPRPALRPSRRCASSSPRASPPGR